jgi:hypothetical protein
MHAHRLGVEPDPELLYLAAMFHDAKNAFLRVRYDGQKDRPETTGGTVNADILEHFDPGLERTTTVERILGSAWPS